MRLGFLCLLCSSTVAAQGIAVGVKGGLPLSQAFDAHLNPRLPNVTAFYLVPDYDSGTQRTVPYTIGPSIEVKLWYHFGRKSMPYTADQATTTRQYGSSALLGGTYTMPISTH